jgi:drug/metabolite transporter (DMT)-like permease
VVLAFALAAAALFGSADFLGGMASRQTRAASVLVISAPAGAVLVLAAALLAGIPFQTAGLGWALAAGAAGGAGLIIFYAGLAAGPMSVVAPVSALVSTVLPVGAALAMGERASAAVYAGAALCLLAIVLVSMQAPPAGPARGLARRRVAARGLGYGVASGLAFGIFFLFIRNAGTSGVLWPVCVARVAGSLIILGVAAWLGTRPVGPGAGRWVLPAAVAAGVLDAGANVCYVLAARAGLFGMAVVITSLYPGITVLLARVVLGERMRAAQRTGLVLAAAGVAMVTF